MSPGLGARIGVSPILWQNEDDPSLGGIDLEDCLDQAHRAGYAGIELGHLFPRDPGQLRDLVDRHGLRLVSGWTSGHLRELGPTAEIAAVAEHAALLRQLGCDLLVYADVGDAVHRLAQPLSTRPQLAAGAWPGFCAALDELARALGDAGIRMAYHHHMGTVVQTAVEIERLLDGTSDAVGLTLDTGHFAYAEGGSDSLAAFVTACAARVTHVHLKDVRAPTMAAALTHDDPFLVAVAAGVFTVPGDGAIPMEPVIAALAAADYRGWLVVEAEQDPRFAEPFAFAKLGFDNVARWIC